MSKIKVIVFDATFNIKKELSGNFIPRVGDKIDMGYSPSPDVKQVVYMPDANNPFKEEAIFITV